MMVMFRRLGLVMGVLSATVVVHTAMVGFSQEMVMFTANWCAGCREVQPVVQQLATQRGLKVTIIDVDKPDAPKLSQQFGLDIPKRELPQVYAQAKKGQSTLIYDGATHLWGQPEAIQAKIAGQLERLK